MTYSSSSFLEILKIVVSGDTSSLKDEIVRLTHLSSAGNFGDDQISPWVPKVLRP